MGYRQKCYMEHADLTMTHGPRTAPGNTITPTPSVSSKNSSPMGVLIGIMRKLCEPKSHRILGLNKKKNNKPFC